MLKYGRYKGNFLLVTLIVISSIIQLSATDHIEICSFKPGPERSGGVAATLGSDKTGGPLSGGNTCSQCHSGGNYNPTLNVVVKDMANNIVSAYEPGMTYKLEVTITAVNGTPGGYGMQTVSLDSADQFAGAFGTIYTPNTQVSSIGSVDYLEHQGASTTGIYSVEWIAPASNQGTIGFYMIGLAVDGFGSIAGDDVSAPTMFALPEAQTSVQNLALDQISIYPNPATDGWKIDTKGKQPDSYRITDLHGKVIRDFSTADHNVDGWFEISARGLNKGMYVLEIVIGNDLIRLRLIKE